MSVRRKGHRMLGMVIATMSFLWFGPEAAAQDPIPFFAETGSSPEVLFVLDASPTMNAKVRDANGNSLSYTRAWLVKEQLKKLVADFYTTGIRFGIVRTSNSTTIVPPVCKAGSQLAALGSSTTALQTALDTYYTTVTGTAPTPVKLKDYEGGFVTAKSAINTSLSGDICKDDRKRVVVFITGGGGSILDGCLDDADYYIGQIRDLTLAYGMKIPTYVMGFNLEDDGVSSLAYQRLKEMAVAGETKDPRSARDEKQFVAILNAILVGTFAGDYTSGKPVLAITNDELFQNTFTIYNNDTADASTWKIGWKGHSYAYQLKSDGTTQTPARWDASNWPAVSPAARYSQREVHSAYLSGVLPNQLTQTLFNSSNAAYFDDGMALIGSEYDINFDGSYGSSSSPNTADAATLINFTLGDISKEYNFSYNGERVNRESYWLLDMMSSTPTYVPPPIFPRGESTYRAFQTAQSGRPDYLVVGSNGGMIHAFEAGLGTGLGERISSLNGEELWSYVPRHILPRLKDQWKGDSHPIMLDTTGRYSDVVSNGNWITLYVQGDGIAGDTTKCHTAINTANPNNTDLWNCGWYTALDVSKVGGGGGYTFAPLWEFPGYGDILYAASEPAVGRVRVKLGASTEVRDVAFLAGRGSTVTFGSNVVGCRAPIYVIDLDSGRPLGATNYSLDNLTDVPSPYDSRIFLSYRTSSGCSSSNNHGNLGIRSRIVAVDTNADLLTDRLYVGDMEGRLWRVLLDNTNPGTWKSSASVIYTAPTQMPFMYAPSVTYSPDGDILVYVGQGSPDTLSAYGSPSPTGNFQVLLDNRAGTSAVLYTGTGKFSVPTLAAGEVMAGEPVIVNGIVYFTTFTPSSTSCRYGTARLYGLKYLTGEAGLDSSDPDSAFDSKYIDLGIGIPSGVVVGKDSWYVAVNDGTAGGKPVTASGDLGINISTNSNTRTYSWLDVLGRPATR